MSSTKGTILLVAGMGIGFGAGLVVSNGASTGPTGTGPGASATPERVVQLERELTLVRSTVERERSARVQIETERASTEREVLVLRERVAALASPSVAAILEGAAAVERPEALAARSSTSGSKTLSEDEKAARLRALLPEIEAAIKSGDAKKMIELLDELATLGKEAWPKAVELSLAAAHAIQKDPAQAQALGMAYFRSLTAYGELHEDAISDPSGRYPLEFRHLAVGYFPYTARGAKQSLLVEKLATEPDVGVGQAMATMLSFSKDASHSAGLVRALGAQPQQGIRLRIVSTLAELPGDEAKRGLEDAARADQDPEVRRAAEYALKSKEQSAVGWFLTYVAPTSQLFTAGLREGDVLTTVRGITILSAQDIYRVFQVPKEKDGAGIALVVQRAGATFQVTIQGLEALQQLFAAGRFVRPDGD